MMNVGHTYPAVSDMDTIGSPIKYSMCVAENEAESPWEPYHIEKGFPRDSSTVTVHFAYGSCDAHDFVNHQPEPICDVYCTAATNIGPPATGMWLLGRRADPRYGTDEKEHNFMLICPEHAHNFSKAGWNKDTIREYMYKHSQMPFRRIMIKRDKAALMVAHPELQWLLDSEDTLVPIVESPDCFDIAVVGGAAGRGAYVYGAGEPVTKPIVSAESPKAWIS
jgi:hypothetical protein